MAADRLARIEERLRAEVSAGHLIGVFPVTDMRTLVEIAKAARWFASDGNRTTANDPAWQRLSAALARLDSGATEGDT